MCLGRCLVLVICLILAGACAGDDRPRLRTTATGVPAATPTATAPTPEPASATAVPRPSPTPTPESAAQVMVRFVPAELPRLGEAEVAEPWVGRTGGPSEWLIYRVQDGGAPELLYRARRYVRWLACSSTRPRRLHPVEGCCTSCRSQEVRRCR
jgi:hypothetical protein